jgi:hypothetical protein
MSSVSGVQALDFQIAKGAVYSYSRASFHHYCCYQALALRTPVNERYWRFCANNLLVHWPEKKQAALIVSQGRRQYLH